MYFGRGKNKIQDPYTFVDTYKDYIKNVELDSKYYVPYIIYSRICSEYYKEVANRIIKGDRIKLPVRMGYLTVLKDKPKLSIKTCKLPMDWVNSVKYKKQIRNLNTHTKGYRYSVYWDKSESKVLYLYSYMFILCRAAKRALAKNIKSNNYDYFEKNLQ